MLCICAAKRVNLDGPVVKCPVEVDMNAVPYADRLCLHPVLDKRFLLDNYWHLVPWDRDAAFGVYAGVLRACIEVWQVKVVTVERDHYGVFTDYLERLFQQFFFTLAWLCFLNKWLAGARSVVRQHQHFSKAIVCNKANCSDAPVVVAGGWHPALFCFNFDVDSHSP